MQQALIQIQAERDVLNDHLRTRDRGTAAAPSASVMRMAMGGVALSLIAVVAMSVVLLTPPARARTHEVATKIVYLPAPASAVPAPALAAAPVVATPTVTKPLGVTHPRPLRHSTTATAGQPNLTVCGDDPLCGLNFKQ